MRLRDWYRDGSMIGKKREREGLSSHIIWTGKPEADAAIRGLAYDMTHTDAHIAN